MNLHFVTASFTDVNISRLYLKCLKFKGDKEGEDMQELDLTAEVIGGRNQWRRMIQVAHPDLS